MLHNFHWNADLYFYQWFFFALRPYDLNRAYSEIPLGISDQNSHAGQSILDTSHNILNKHSQEWTSMEQPWGYISSDVSQWHQSIYSHRVAPRTSTFGSAHYEYGLQFIIFNSVLKPEYSGQTRSITWQLMTWLLASPGHQQPWYWLCDRKSVIYLHHLWTEIWWKIKLYL